MEKRWGLRAAAAATALTLTLTGAWAAEPAAAQEQVQPAGAAEETVSTPWQLVLVNAWHTLPADFTVETTAIGGGLRVDRRIAQDLQTMLADCRKAGLKPMVCSAYRTRATQQRLYRNKIARLRAAGYAEADAIKEAGRWVAPPDTSEHQTGLALDLISSRYQVLDQKQEDTAEQKWLMEHSWEYGFVLRYPTDKSAITGIGYEPWHYRYVGRDAAVAMHASGQCLEEYLGLDAAPLEGHEQLAAQTLTQAGLWTLASLPPR